MTPGIEVTILGHSSMLIYDGVHALKRRQLDQCVRSIKYERREQTDENKAGQCKRPMLVRVVGDAEAVENVRGQMSPQQVQGV